MNYELLFNRSKQQIIVVIMLFTLTQTSFFSKRGGLFLESGIPVFFQFLFQLILPMGRDSNLLPLELQVGDALAFSAI